MTTMTDSAAQPAASVQDDDILLEINNLKMYFPVTSGMLFQRTVAYVKAVDDVSFAVRRGETLGLVGESGCGKTTTGRCILQLYKPTGGEVKFEGQDLTKLGSKQMRAMRREMQVIFQDPYSSLNPRMTAGNIIGEPLVVHGLVSGRNEYRERVADLLQNVGLNPYMADRFPHEFSGGQRQRIGVARALSVSPKFIVADEPVSASGRVDSGPDHQPPGRAPGAVQPDLPVHRPRPLSGETHQRPGGRHVPGPHGRDSRAKRDLSKPSTPVHPRAAFGRADSRPDPGRTTGEGAAER